MEQVEFAVSLAKGKCETCDNDKRRLQGCFDWQDLKREKTIFQGKEQ